MQMPRPDHDWSPPESSTELSEFFAGLVLRAGPREAKPRFRLD